MLKFRWDIMRNYLPYALQRLPVSKDYGKFYRFLIPFKLQRTPGFLLKNGAISHSSSSEFHYSPKRAKALLKAKAQVLEINTIIDVVTDIISTPCISEILEPPLIPF